MRHDQLNEQQEEEQDVPMADEVPAITAEVNNDGLPAANDNSPADECIINDDMGFTATIAPHTSTDIDATAPLGFLSREGVNGCVLFEKSSTLTDTADNVLEDMVSRNDVLVSVNGQSLHPKDTQYQSYQDKLNFIQEQVNQSRASSTMLQLVFSTIPVGEVFVPPTERSPRPPVHDPDPIEFIMNSMDCTNEEAKLAFNQTGTCVDAIQLIQDQRKRMSEIEDSRLSREERSREEDNGGGDDGDTNEDGEKGDDEGLLLDMVSCVLYLCGCMTYD